MKKNRWVQQIVLISFLLIAASIIGGCQSEEEEKVLRLEAYELEVREANRFLTIEPFKNYLEASPLLVKTEEWDRTAGNQAFVYDIGSSNALGSIADVMPHHRYEGFPLANDLFADTLIRISIIIEKDVLFEPEYQKLIEDLILMVDSEFDYADFYMKIKEMDPLKDNTYPFGVGSIEFSGYDYNRSMKKRVESPLISIYIDPYSSETIREIRFEQ